MGTTTPDLSNVRAWPFEEAAKVAARPAVRAKASALFETGYGPSGLPHIGTFGEVARTTWVRRAFERLTGMPSRLIAFSDDMDGLRKVPDNVPNPDVLRRFLGRPLTRIPDPFLPAEELAAFDPATAPAEKTFGGANNARLRAFLDAFGFDYEFASSSDYYRSGRFDTALLRMLQAHEEVRGVILPTLGPDRRATYSPFLPIHPKTGVVMQVPMEETRPADGTVVWRDPETGERFETPVTGGHVKAQWKADWALRWFALGVDYEMSGKDLIDSVRLSSQICRILGAEPPVGFTYELFLDAEGGKISKSKGNGMTIEEWLRYGPPESLSLFMYQQPGRAKRLHFDVIPRATDEYLGLAERLRTADDPANATWHLHDGRLPNGAGSPIPYSMLLNLAVAANADTPDMLWGYLRRHAPDATAEAWPMLATLVDRAVAYYVDRVKPTKQYRPATEAEQEALLDLAHRLREHEAEIAALPAAERPGFIQNLVYDAGRREPFLQPGKGPEGRPGVSRAWFAAIYQVLLGQEEGPRFGGFVALYGVPETIALIETTLAKTPETA
ncbi:lysine--tRNA ligase [Roseomonas sp. CCTCC AB2023176]|uniref:lysine--tRNA ligase n=1 Tax=Roseomonas sp. CCTCC AB2023176 TaxID=3342640 RepID=UPI0035D68DCC